VVLYGTAVGPPDAGPTPADRTAFDLVSHIRTGGLVDVAKVLTAIGSAFVIVPVALGAAVALGKEGRWAELGVLVAGVLVILVGVDTVKAAVDRPRPVGALTATVGSSFPSGHAAQAMLYPFLAVVAVLHRPALRHRQRTAILSVGCLLALVVGLTRVYLHVHYLSDVIGGWAFGAAAFAAAGAAAMVVVHLRET
jgi:undecaprenyl-diphosphatase